MPNAPAYPNTTHKKGTKPLNIIFHPESNINSIMPKQNKSLTFSSVEQFLHYRMTGRKPHPKVKFTPQEDELLRKLVNEYGENDNWNIIAKKMNITYRNVRQCKERWTNYLSPTVNVSPWTPEEDEKLKQLYDELGSKWVQIAKHFPSRTDINIRSRWLVLQRHKKKQLESESAVNNSMPSSNFSSEQMTQNLDSSFQSQFQYFQENGKANDIFSTETTSRTDTLNPFFENSHDEYIPMSQEWHSSFVPEINPRSGSNDESLLDLSPVELTTNDFAFFEDWGFQ